MKRYCFGAKCGFIIGLKLKINTSGSQNALTSVELQRDGKGNISRAIARVIISSNLGILVKKSESFYAIGKSQDSIVFD
jgi:hypothetical protein